jgi:hypothetical protein
MDLVVAVVIVALGDAPMIHEVQGASPGRGPLRRHGVRLAGVGIIVAAFATWVIRSYNAAVGVSLSASRHPISGASTPTGEDGVTLRVTFRRQRPVRVHVEYCEAEIQLLGGLHGLLDVGSQVGWALTQALHATNDGNSLSSGSEVSYQVSFWAPHDRALDVKVTASGAPKSLHWIGWPAWSASIIIPPADLENRPGAADNEYSREFSIAVGLSCAAPSPASLVACISELWCEPNGDIGVDTSTKWVRIEGYISEEMLHAGGHRCGHVALQDTASADAPVFSNADKDADRPGELSVDN